jgi:ubiquitin-like modifier-activating enzyme ATG7
MIESLEILNLKEGLIRITNDENGVVVVVDMDNDKYTYSWHLRNILALLSIQGLVSANIIALRNNLLDKIHSATIEELLDADTSMFLQVLLGDRNVLDDYKIVGWEYNLRGKPGPRIVNCSNFMNAKDVMNQAVDLNIKLMKWRQWPDLDTEKL